MLKGIDHVVIVVADLDRAIASFEALGFTVVRGGRHTGLGTHNALIAFADGAYFELIAFRVPASTHRWFAAVSKGGGLTDFCMQTGDLDADAAIFKRAGTAVSEAFAMERERPDGYMLKWVLAVAEPPSAGAVPFLIRDITPRDERVPRARVHRNGAAGIRTLTVAVEDAAAVMAHDGDEFVRLRRRGPGWIAAPAAARTTHRLVHHHGLAQPPAVRRVSLPRGTFRLKRLRLSGCEPRASQEQSIAAPASQAGAHLGK